MERFSFKKLSDVEEVLNMFAALESLGDDSVISISRKIVRI
jgi:hypothetical protein